MKIAVAGGTGTVGRHIVDVLTEQGHQPLVLSRAAGVDLTTGRSLADALAGATAVIDVSSTQTQADEASRAFFGTVTQNLLAAEQAAGVRHHVALGIVGSTLAPYGYYAGKALQEQLVEASPVPWTILRATQFHEFAQQIYGSITAGPFILVPKMTSQPVAAREVAEHLVALALANPAGHTTDLAGPHIEQMPHMVRAYAKATGKRGPIITIPAPGPFGKALRDGTILPKGEVTLGRQSFAEWLAAL